MTAPATAETAITAQATASDGAFLPWAPAPAQRAGLCLVDTGVNINPDTQSTLVERTAIDSGSGDDVSPTTHGTVLAMMASAPVNGWGMVGVAPGSIQIVSVRILEPGQTTFPFSSYAAGITACLRVHEQYDVRVINLSLGSSGQPSSGDYEALGDAIERAGNYGIAVVASAGNDDGGPVGYPAAYSGVLSVGADDTQSGAFCSFSNRGEGLRLTAPGCDLDGADPKSGASDFNYWQGTSESSVIVAAALTALDAYRPGLSPQAAETYLTGADGGTLDIAQSFHNASLQQIVTAGEAAEPPQPSTPSQTGTGAGSVPVVAKPPQEVGGSKSMGLTAPFTAPRARLRRVKDRIVLVLSGRPREALAEVLYLGRRPHARQLRVTRTLIGSFASLTLPSSVRTVRVRYTDPYDIQRASSWRALTVPATVAGTFERGRGR